MLKTKTSEIRLSFIPWRITSAIWIISLIVGYLVETKGYYFSTNIIVIIINYYVSWDYYSVVNGLMFGFLFVWGWIFWYENSPEAVEDERYFLT